MDWGSKKRKIGEIDNDILLGSKSDTTDVSMEDNHIYFYCEVSRKNILELIKNIRFLNNDLLNMKNKYDSNDLNIYLHINSYGGNIFAALAVIDVILSSKIKVISIIEGCAASAATLISMVCQERRISLNSFMLIHQLTSNFWGKMNEIDDEYENLQNLHDLIKKLYKKHTNIKMTGKNGLTNILKRDIWWNSNTCLEIGLVDEIV